MPYSSPILPTFNYSLNTTLTNSCARKRLNAPRCMIIDDASQSSLYFLKFSVCSRISEYTFS